MTTHRKDTEVALEDKITKKQLREEVQALRLRLEESEETLRAIRNNEVDALVIDGPEGQQVFSLQGAERPYRALMESMSEGALTAGMDGTILYCNQRIAEMLCAPLNKIIGASFREMFPAEEWEVFKAFLDESGQQGYRGECHLTTFEGRLIPVYISARVLQLDDVDGFCAVVTDLTEQRKLEEQVRQAQKMEALGTMAGGIAHDFNNILAGIIGFTELLQEDLPPENPGHRWAARVLEAGMRGRDLVRHMLMFSRQTELERKPLRLSSIIKESARFLRASTPSTIDINLNVKNESSLIMADPVQMQQVVLNLCTNATYAMRETGGVLDIDLRDVKVGQPGAYTHDIEPGIYVRILVRDTGPGIPAQIRNRIFDPFFTTKAVGEGTGLGLSVVMGIVKQLEGHIFLESEPGNGSSFFVYFPRVTGEPMTLFADAEKPLPTGSERILFVDDEETLIEMGQHLLRKLGYEVTCQKNSEAALALLKEDPFGFDLLITDQTMPRMTGLDLAQAVLSIRPDMPIILCTGFSHQIDADFALAVGIRGFAMKPLTKKEMARTIRSVFENQDPPQ